MRSLPSVTGWLVAAAIAGCSSTPAEVNTPELEPTTSAPKSGSTEMSIQAEVGALNEDKVNTSFKNAMPTINKCLDSARKRLPFIGGTLAVVLRIDGEGAVSSGFFRRSTMGDGQTEKCVMDAFKAQTWPKPVGGKEGEARTSFELPPDPDERQPVAWTPEDLGEGLDELRSELQKCRADAGTGPLEITFFVDPDGKVMAAGGQMADEKGDAALDCAVKAVERRIFPTPGSFPAKVSLST